MGCIVLLLLGFGMGWAGICISLGRFGVACICNYIRWLIFYWSICTEYVGYDGTVKIMCTTWYVLIATKFVCVAAESGYNVDEKK